MSTPVEIWLESGRGFPNLSSPWQMLKYRGEALHKVGVFLGILQGIAICVPAAVDAVRGTLGAQPGPPPGMSSEHLKKLGVEFPEYRRALQEVGLELSLDSFERLERGFAEQNLNYDRIGALVNELEGRIRDELSHIQLWQVTREEARFLKVNPFGEDIAVKFPSARDDIEEAGKCLAFARGTACVFHLMRVMEIGLRALGTSLNDAALDPRTNPTWEKILGRGDRELQKPLKDRSPEWRADEEFFSAAQANLRAVKDAWRNPTMHVERRYDPEEAEEVWNAVRALMRHLAKNLSA